MLKTFRNSRGSGGWTSSGGLERERGGIGSNHPNLNLDQRGRSSGTCTFSAMGEAVKPVPDRPPSLELLWLLGSSPPPPGAATPTARVAAAASRAYSSSWCRRRRTGGEGSGHGVGGGQPPWRVGGQGQEPPVPRCPQPLRHPTPGFIHADSEAAPPAAPTRDDGGEWERRVGGGEAGIGHVIPGPAPGYCGNGAVALKREGVICRGRGCPRAAPGGSANVTRSRRGGSGNLGTSWRGGHRSRRARSLK